jgi:hypothetical protein
MKVMLTFLIALLLATPTGDTSSEIYPNELAGFRFHATAQWRALVPLRSTIADVRNAMGEPFNATDLADYFSPYPGDESANAPLLEYAMGSEWRVFIYFVTRDAAERPGRLHGLGGRVRSIELLPNSRVSFSDAEFPSVFTKHRVVAADAVWDDYTDTHGLTYAIYAGRPAHGDAVAGDLNRIRYGSPGDREAGLVGE